MRRRTAGRPVKQINLKLDADLAGRFDKLCRDHPMASAAGFAMEAVRRGLPSIEEQYAVENFKPKPSRT